MSFWIEQNVKTLSKVNQEIAITYQLLLQLLNGIIELEEYLFLKKKMSMDAIVLELLMGVFKKMLQSMISSPVKMENLFLLPIMEMNFG